MPKEYTKEELKKLREKISPDVLKILLSESTPLQISEICIRNGIEEEGKIEEIAHQIGLVLLGQLSPAELRAVLEEKVKLDPLTATKVNQEINNAIFQPIKSSLEKIYEIEMAPPARPKVPFPPKPPEEKPEVPPRKDIYREPIE